MGLFDKLKSMVTGNDQAKQEDGASKKPTFGQMMKRLNFNLWGIATGSDFRNGNLPNAYLGKADNGESDKLMIYGENIEDYVFGKDNVESIAVLQQEVYFKMGNNRQMLGPKYEVKFKDGKTALICIPANDAYRLEQVLF